MIDMVNTQQDKASMKKIIEFLNKKIKWSSYYKTNWLFYLKKKNKSPLIKN